MFGHPYCSSKDSTKFNAERKNICQFSCHIGSNIPAFSFFFLVYELHVCVWYVIYDFKY